MGGYGSGRWGGHVRKLTTEECPSVRISPLPSSPRHRRDRAARRTFEEAAAAGFMVSVSSRDGRASVSATLHTTTTPAGFGGRRFWFVCPMPACGRRCVELFFPGRGPWGCRRCHRLTYTSRRDSHRGEAFWARVAVESGTSPGLLARDLRQAFRIVRLEATRRRAIGTALRKSD